MDDNLHTIHCMGSEIVSMMRRYIDLTDAEASIVERCIPVRFFQRGTVLLREGDVSTESYQNLSGLVRKYYLVDGVEVTTDFYEEGSSIASFTSLTRGTPAKHFLECVEDSRLAVLSKENEQELFARIPKYEALCRASVEQNMGERQDSMAAHLMNSPEQRYINLLNERPQLLNRIPLYSLASYIGVKPESLSRIRKRVRDRQRADKAD